MIELKPNETYTMGQIKDLGLTPVVDAGDILICRGSPNPRYRGNPSGRYWFRAAGEGKWELTETYETIV
jgi:hypothetical protein